MAESSYLQLEALTKREIEILQAFIDLNGDYNAIANKLYLSTSTVRCHANNIFQKLGVNDRLSAVLKGLRQGLIKL